MRRWGLALEAAVLCLLVPGAGLAIAYPELYPLLVDLPGWEAEKPTGFGISTQEGETACALRRYRRGKATLQVALLSGAQASGSWTPFEGRISIETPEMTVKVIRIDGFPVGTIHRAEDQGGSVVVLLRSSPPAVLALQYTGLSAEEALRISRRFDWRRMAEAMGR